MSRAHVGLIGQWLEGQVQTVPSEVDSWSWDSEMVVYAACLCRSLEAGVGDYSGWKNALVYLEIGAVWNAGW